MRHLSKKMILLTTLFCLLNACNANHNQNNTTEQYLNSPSPTVMEKQTKKVILFVVDSLESQYIDYGLATDKAPALKFLIDHGQYYREMVSSFPTMSVVIDSSLLTGNYPDQHHVPGITWYSEKERRVINYGTGNQEVMANGLNLSLIDVFIHLNKEQLNPSLPTVHEEISSINKTSGSINGLIFRGSKKQSLTFPAWIYLPTKLPKHIEVNGPDFFAYGAFANPLKNRLVLPDGPTKTMGFNNRYSIKTIQYLIEKKRLPDFLLVYLPDLDKKVHDQGPDHKWISKVDKEFQQILNRFSSWDKALEEFTFIIMGDSGQTKVFGREQDPIIPLHTLLKDLKVLPTGEKATKKYQVALAVNERMSFIYSLSSDVRLSQIVQILKKDDRIDHLAWEENGWITVMKPSSDKIFRYKSGGRYLDPYGQFWSIDGDPMVLDITMDKEKNLIKYHDYPDPLRRLEASLHSHQGKFIIANAKPGYDFVSNASPKHIEGGAHGSLLSKDSYVPLIISGTKLQPKTIRLVDLKPFILELLKRE